MKRTKVLVMIATIVLGIGSAAQAKLPADSIMIGSNVYNIGYLNNPANLLNINDQLMNNLGSIYFIDSSGKAKDIFTEAVVEDNQIAAKVGNTLTYYTSAGTKKKIVTNSNGEYTDPADTNTNMFAIVNVNYKTITTGFSMYSVKATQVEGISNAAYFKVGDSAITPLTDIATYIGGYSSGSGILFSLYASDGITELANGYANLNQGSSTSGNVNVSIILTQTSAQNPADNSTHGNTALNLTNNGFAAIDKNNSWIYYKNTADSNKLYRKSVTGVDDYVISDDSVNYVNTVGDWVYYSSYKDGGNIYKVRTDGTQRQKICDDMASYINVVGDKIYYINNSDRGRIYIIDSQGRRQFISDSAKQLAVGDSFLFYINASDGNKLYSYNLLNNGMKTKLSDISAEFISVSGDYLIYYSGKDGKLYRSTGSYTNHPTPLSVITNIPQKGSANMKSVADKTTAILGVSDNNIYYISYVDGRKIYKLDSTGNGYKVVDDSADFINIVGDSLYYMKSGKVSVIPKDSDGSTKGTAVTKPKLTEKVVSIDPLPTFSTDDITNFNFPDRVSAIMSDGTIRQLVVNWNKTVPKPQKGVYNFTGSILGYGTKVTLSVALDSGTINAGNIIVVNEVGSKDTVTVKGANTKLKPGDIVSVYTNMSDTKPAKTAVVDNNGNAVISGLNLDPNGTTIYVTVTATGKAEGSKIAVSCPAEAPTGFQIDAQNQKITGLKPGKAYKVYINDQSTDGSIPALPSDYITASANGDGEIIVSNMQSKITGNKDLKQMLRVVLAGNVDSMPSTPIEISKAKVPDYVSIDLNLGRIVGSTAGMQYRYNTDDWKDCQGGSTPISMTMSLQVQVKVKASGPVMESDVETFGLFPMPVVTGLENGKIYSTGVDADGKSTFPEVSWNTGKVGSITYSAKLTRKDGTLISDNETPSTILSHLKASGNGDYILTVTATKTDTNMNPSTATNSKVINFTINSAKPSVVDIDMIEKPGTKKAKPTDPDTYHQATPTWTNLAGTYSTATITMTHTASGTPGSVTYTPVPTPATVAFVPGNTITQNGEYKLVVTTTSRENGAVTTTEKTFRVDSIDTAVSPTVTGVTNGGAYNGAVTPKVVDDPNCTTKATIMLNGYTTDYPIDPTTHEGRKVTVNGSYVLILNTTNNINGSTKETKIVFTMNDISSISADVSSITPTNNPSGDDYVKVNDTIPYGSVIKVYSSTGNLIGSATNNSVAGPVTVTITGGFPNSDTSIYVTRTDSGKQESNKTKFPIALVPSIKSVSPTTLTETAANDGTVSGTISGASTDTIVVEIQNGTIDNSIAKADVTQTNLPAGLGYDVKKLDDTHLGIIISGKASDHANADDINYVTFTIDKSKVAGATENLTTVNIKIDFNDPVELKVSPTALTEAAVNDGTVTGNIIVTVNNGTLTDPSASDSVTDSTGYVTAANLPAGLHYNVTKVDSTHLQIAISGKAAANATADSVNNVAFTIKAGKIVGAAGDLATGNISVNFKDKSTLTYSSNGFSEAAANNGTIGAPITITLTGDAFAGNVGDDFVSKGLVTVSNVPGGLSAKITKTSASVLTVTLQGNATLNASANNVSNLIINFADGAFANEPAAQITNSKKSDLTVTFTD
ncbi:DUF5050 domain-containing protein [Clostridium sp. A1-XYC3]|uniref:DUF5050 domain-containing protein n=1 Tax=Clostridium tanneri TaxID=3037988 RepID=A0ABU4JNG5_9CLOT|nr:DUF5050 domain-containing protein [Clostridium sp. A1-XYC3]MDW8799669.1 DUF5050 domain-containing protein [Clostridium sp. A1-XYC3]